MPDEALLVTRPREIEGTRCDECGQQVGPRGCCATRRYEQEERERLRVEQAQLAHRLGELEREVAGRPTRGELQSFRDDLATWLATLDADDYRREAHAPLLSLLSWALGEPTSAASCFREQVRRRAETIRLTRAIARPASGAV